MKKRSRIYAYVGAFRFPDKDAAAKRVFGIGKIISNLGHKVIFLGGEQGGHSEQQYKGFSFYSQGELDRGAKSVRDKVKAFFNSGTNTVSWLKRNKESIDSVILYNSSYVFFTRIKKFCDEHDKELIIDCTEWYSGSHLPGGKFGLVSIDNILKMTLGYPTVNKMIVISSYLEKYYSRYKVQTCLVPPLNSYPDVPLNMAGNRPLTFIYAGSPGQKDDLLTVMRVVGRSEFIDKINFKVIGVSSSFLGGIVVPSNVSFLGRLCHDDVIEHYRSSSFSVIIRPNKRYAHAGFSTKFVESIFFGVPVIATRTSDLDRYIVHAKNGFLLGDFDNLEEDLAAVFTEIIGLDDDEILSIREAAKILSENFDVNRYESKLKAFLDS